MKTKVSSLGSPRKKESSKTYKQSHTAGSQKGLGDYYGTGVRQPLGRVRGDTVGMFALSKEQLGKPPKSLA